jgi:hypothetical protein
VAQAKKAIRNATGGTAGSGGSSSIGLSNADPLMDGIESPGSSHDASRADHRHPSNTAKLAVNATMTNTEIDTVMSN